MLTSFLHHPLTQVFGWTLLHSLWQLTIIVAAAWIVGRVLQRRSANARYVAAGAFLVLMAAAPVLTFFWLRPAQIVMPVGASATLTHASLSNAPAVVVGSSVFDLSKPPLRAPVAGRISDYLLPAPSYAAAGYLCGLLVFGLRLLMGYGRLLHIRRTGIPDAAAQELAEILRARLGVARRTRILQSVLVEVPTVLGALRPVILLPMSAVTGLTPEHLSALLAHELAHVRRHDYVANLVQSVMETVLFYHPAVWWLSARIRAERENCCDDMAARTCGSAVVYADALTRMEVLRATAAPVVPAMMRARLALGALGRGAALLPRVRRLLGLPARAERGSRFLTASSVVVGTLFVASVLYVAEYANAPATQSNDGSVAASPATQPATQGKAEIASKIGKLINEAYVAASHQQYDQALSFVGMALELDADGKEAKHSQQELEDRAMAAAGYFVDSAASTKAAGPIGTDASKGGDMIASERYTLPPGKFLPLSTDDFDTRAGTSFEERAGHIVRRFLHARNNDVVKGILERKIDAFSCDGRGLDKVVDDLTTKMGVNIVIDTKALATYNIDKTTPVSLNLKNVSGKEVLTALVKQAGGKTVELAFGIDGGIIVISTNEELQSTDHRTIQVYDIRDLLSYPAYEADSPQTEQDVRDVEVKAITDSITTLVDPESWRDNGGKVGSLKELNGQLIVNQTVDNQVAVYTLIEQLRQAGKMRIDLEEMIFTVDATTFQALQQQYLPLIRPLEVSSLAPGSLGQEAAAPKNDSKIYGKVLSGGDLNDLLRTVNAAPSRILVAKPRLALINGQKGNIAITKKQDYIASYKVRNPGDAKPEYAAETATVEPGVVVESQSTITADHRYVVAKLGLTARQLRRMEDAVAPNTPGAIKLMVQKPVMTEQKMAAGMYSIPDGETLVIGGARIPGLTADGKAAPGEDRYLLLLVRPKIVMQHDAAEGK